jgi:DNA-binding MarR family transcriptional regulator
MNLDRSTVTRLISFLDKKRIVSRSKEGRTVTVTLLAKGVALLPEIHACWKELYQAYCVIFGEKEANAVNEMIARTKQKL